MTNYKTKTRRKYYNKTNTCDNIREDGKKCENKLKPRCAYREYEKGNWTGRWLCLTCRNKNYYRDKIKNDPNSQGNIIKRLRKRRMGNLDQNSSQAKGDLFEELTCIWRGVKNLNIEDDNYISPIDHSRDHEFGILQTRGRFRDLFDQRWTFGSLEKDHFKDFDNMICYCANKDGSRIERIYIFPKDEIIKRKTITILKNPGYCRGPFWYEQYRVNDENIIKKIDKIFQTILLNKRKK